MKKRIISILLVGTLILGIMLPTFAASTSELKSKLNDAKEEKQETTEAKNEVIDEISELDVKIDEYESQISELNKKVEELKDSITTKEKEIKQLEADFEEKEDLLAERLVAMYESGQTTYLDILLSSDGITNFISSYYMAEQLAEADQEVMDSILEQQTTIEKTKKEMEEEKQEVSTAKKEVETKNAALTTAKSSKQSKVNQLSAKEKQLQSKIDEFNAAIKKAEQERNSQISSSGSSGKYQGSFSGVLGWPLSSSSPNYNLISSYFGPRQSPTAGESSNHGAVDIAVRYQPVYAPADGKVIIASVLSGYGNYIMIDHGNGYYTGFGHLSAYSVSKGDVVKRGQKIATSGNTGISTGPHLHFEVYIGGTSNSCRVDPLAYTSHPSLNSL